MRLGGRFGNDPEPSPKRSASEGGVGPTRVFLALRSTSPMATVSHKVAIMVIKVSRFMGLVKAVSAR